MDERSPAQPYTVHEDVQDAEPGTGTGTVVDEDEATDRAPARTGPDPIALVGGLAVILIAVLALTGVIATIGPRWILAIAAVSVGLAVLLVTLRRR